MSSAFTSTQHVLCSFKNLNKKALGKKIVEIIVELEVYCQSAPEKYSENVIKLVCREV